MSRVTVLWRIDAHRHIDCVLYESAGQFVLQVERGSEAEVFWSFPAASLRDVLTISQTLRSRLINKGWVLVHADGERQLTVTAA